MGKCINFFSELGSFNITTILLSIATVPWGLNQASHWSSIVCKKEYNQRKSGKGKIGQKRISIFFTKAAADKVFYSNISNLPFGTSKYATYFKMGTTP